MSRVTPEVQRHSYSPESRDSSQREDRAMHMQDALASRGGWDFWVARAFLVACTGAVSYTLGPFGLRGSPAVGVGLLIALAVLLAELRPRRARLCRASVAGVSVDPPPVSCLLFDPPVFPP